ncbi:MAG: bifunctional DNA-formamidopyrimidine glycosylase/DNA-(apurinic or apyrimidinic site) lyase [Xanthomonadales bacterium]|nr:bifunctional DNA-formamidopyrimidine glycosylase/DNA-(apurinic or apyrimidinic site) lyase [Xanthomonadales bacterium]
MPELPEVETTLRGIAPHMEHRVIDAIEVRDDRLRQKIPTAVQRVVGHQVESLRRRAKYILIRTANGTLLIHLGMSGSLRVLTSEQEPSRHDHFDIVTGGTTIRYNDPRRFGLLLWHDSSPESHPLLSSLGPEPLGDAFDGDYLYQKSRGRRLAVKNYIMDGRVVVGVGNIYASEALFMAGISPVRAAGRVSLARYRALAAAIRDVLARAIRRGGTTLRDFVDSDGAPGYFAQELLVYGRAGQACFQCGRALQQRVIGQRSSFYCKTCQS